MPMHSTSLAEYTNCLNLSWHTVVLWMVAPSGCVMMFVLDRYSTSDVPTQRGGLAGHEKASKALWMSPTRWD